MKQTARKSRAATRFKNSEKVEMVIKKEEEMEVSLRQRETNAIASLDPIVKTEEMYIDLKLQIAKVEEEKRLN